MAQNGNGGFYFLDRNCISKINLHQRLRKEGRTIEDEKERAVFEGHITRLRQLDKPGNIVCSILSTMEGENSPEALTREGRRSTLREEARMLNEFYAVAKTDADTNQRLEESFLDQDMRKQEWGFSKYVQLHLAVWDGLAGSIARKDRKERLKWLIAEAVKLNIHYPTSLVFQVMLAKMHGSGMAQNILKFNQKTQSPDSRKKISENAVSDLMMVFRFLEFWAASIQSGRKVPFHLFTFDDALDTFTKSLRPRRMEQERTPLATQSRFTATPHLESWFATSQKNDLVLFKHDIEKLKVLENVYF